jgi:hypothetical protein
MVSDVHDTLKVTSHSEEHTLSIYPCAHQILEVWQYTIVLDEVVFPWEPESSSSNNNNNNDSVEQQYLVYIGILGRKDFEDCMMYDVLLILYNTSSSSSLSSWCKIYRMNFPTIIGTSSSPVSLFRLFLKTDYQLLIVHQPYEGNSTTNVGMSSTERNKLYIYQINIVDIITTHLLPSTNTTSNSAVITQAGCLQAHHTVDIMQRRIRFVEYNEARGVLAVIVEGYVILFDTNSEEDEEEEEGEGEREEEQEEVSQSMDNDD